MKVTVGAIRQIVREEAGRLEEGIPVATAGDVVDTFGRSGSESFEQVKDAAKTNKAVVSAFTSLVDKATNKLGELTLQQIRTAALKLGIELAVEEEVQAESIARDELRNIIMAEAAELVQD